MPPPQGSGGRAGVTVLQDITGLGILTGDSFPFPKVSPGKYWKIPCENLQTSVAPKMAFDSWAFHSGILALKMDVTNPVGLQTDYHPGIVALGNGISLFVIIKVAKFA